jgi:uncharacterized membrane protein YwaF
MVDIFGPSPYYIIGLVITGAVVYIVLWLPFYIVSKINFLTERKAHEKS